MRSVQLFHAKAPRDRKEFSNYFAVFASLRETDSTEPLPKDYRCRFGPYGCPKRERYSGDLMKASTICASTQFPNWFSFPSQNA
jgi:hypothetical protein